MQETLFQELKRYVHFEAADEEALRRLHPLLAPHLHDIAEHFYRRILEHDEARTALQGGESTVGRLKITLAAWMDRLLTGPWDEAYYEARARIGRVHVRIALPQHYMFGAMNVIRQEFDRLVDREVADREERRGARLAVGKVMDLELAIMLHTYREDLLAQQSRVERLSTFGQLVGSIGHELRNPLGVIETSLFILRQRLGADERTQKHLDRIGGQVEIANRIISDLLDLIRDRPLQREIFSLQGVIASATESLRKPEGVTLRIEGVDRFPELSGDPGQLRQVFFNLLENAIQAVGQNGEVRLAGRVSAGAVEIAVEDSGPGVPVEVRRRLFEPLITTKEKGIGLGLPLVKRIVEHHGGTVTYAPAASGGARFVVRLPLTATVEPAAERPA